MRTAVLALALALVGSPALAESRNDEARAHYQRGLTAYNLADWDTSIAEFKKAYELSTAPGLLYNLAQSYRLKKDYEQALYFYRGYLRAAPNAPNRADAQRRVRELEKLAATPPPTAAPQVAEPRAAAAPATAVDSTAGEWIAPSVSATPDPVTSVEPARAPKAALAQVAVSHRPLRPWRVMIFAGIGAAAVGVALLATGIYFGTQSASLRDQVTAFAMQRGTWDAQQQSLYREGQRDATLGTALDVTGGLVAAAGATLAIVGWRKTVSARRLAVGVGPGRVGAAFSCAF